MSERPAGRPDETRDVGGVFSAGRGLWAPLVALGLVVAVVAWSWIGFMLREQQDDYWRTLDAVAELKAQQLADWLDQHLRSAAAIGSAEWLAQEFDAWRSGEDPGAGERVFTRLDQLAHAGRFSAVLLADGDGEPLWSGLHRPPPVTAATRADWVAGAASGRATMVGPYLDREGNLHFDYVVALAGGHTSQRAIVVLHTGAEDYLPERFAHFPLPLASGEVGLVRLAGDEVLQLNLPHADPHVPLKARVPIFDLQGPVAQLLLATGDGPLRAQGPDIQGRELMKSGRRVAGTDWMVLASLEIAEVRRQSLGQVLWIALLGGVLFLAAGAVVIVLRQQRSLAQLQARKREQDAQLRAFHLLDAVADNSGDAIFVKDLEGRYILVNRACCEFLGRPSAEVLGRTDHELFPKAQAEELTTIHQRVLKSMGPSTTREVLESARGQRVVMAAKGPLHDQQGRLVGVFGIARDVTEQEHSAGAAEAHSLELAQRNRELERFNEAMVGRELDMLRLKREVNELCVSLGLEPRYGRELIRAGHQAEFEEGDA